MSKKVSEPLKLPSGYAMTVLILAIGIIFKNFNSYGGNIVIPTIFKYKYYSLKHLPRYLWLKCY